MFDFGMLNENQKKAVMTTEGPLLIIAGPGTGKTFTLVKRLAYLVMEKKVDPKEVMVVTFTEKAARELLTRISNEFLKYERNININEMYIGTFHSICLRLLKEYSEMVEGHKARRVLDAFEQTYMVCRNLDDFKYLHGFTEHIPAREGRWKQAQEICRYVNQMMEEMVDIEAMEKDADQDMRFLARLYRRYQELLIRNDAMDFSSIQTETYQMLKNNPEVLKKLQQNIRYIMVDEYQDTNYIQEQLVFLLAGENQNICVVGDDDQGMYRFRGATIRNILEFPDKFSDKCCQKVHLDENYRSEPGIIQFYNDWMTNVNGLNLFNWDKYRYPKEIKPGKQNHLLEQSVYSCLGADYDAEGYALCKMVQNLKANGNISDYNQVAFLFRSVKSEEAKRIADAFESQGIPVYSPRSSMFFERQEVKQILGCFILFFQSYMLDLKKNMFLHNITDDMRRYYISCVKEANVIFQADKDLHDYIVRQQKESVALKGDSDLSLLDLFYRLISFQPFKGYLQADLNDIVIKTRAARNLSEISRMLSKYAFLHDMHQVTAENKITIAEELFNIYLRYYYEDGIGEYEDDYEYAPKGCISFMTIHQSKGLEFPVVVVGSLSGTPRRERDSLLYTMESRFFNRIPFEPMNDIAYFDFWRLYYTAFSRAQNLLVLAGNAEKRKKYFERQFFVLPEINTFSQKDAFETIKAVHYKRMYSFTSHIAVYEGCPMQYKYYKEYGFAQNRMFHTSVGSLVHATLEDLNKCIMIGQEERITEEAIKEWFYLNYQAMQEQTGYYLTEEQQENALQQVLQYYTHRKNDLHKVWKAEEEINLVLPDYILQGIIDLIEGENDTVEIVDYKTGAKPDAARYPERVSHYKKQLEIYAYLVEKRYGKKASRMHLYYTSELEGDPLITFEWNRESVDHTMDELAQTVTKIEQKLFDEEVQNSYACEYCDMKFVCGKAKC